jgi:hypothetical protein
LFRPLPSDSQGASIPPAMNRRAFVTGLGAVLAAQRAAGAQQSRVYRVGVILQGGPYVDTVNGLRDGLRRKWCRSIVCLLKHRGLARATFGRAAKLIAMYLKSMVVLGPACNTMLANVIHPPIDSILVSAISSSAEITCGHAHTWGKTKWTRLNEASY